MHLPVVPWLRRVAPCAPLFWAERVRPRLDQRADRSTQRTGSSGTVMRELLLLQRSIHPPRGRRSGCGEHSLVASPEGKKGISHGDRRALRHAVPSRKPRRGPRSQRLSAQAPRRSRVAARVIRCCSDDMLRYLTPAHEPPRHQARPRSSVAGWHVPDSASSSSLLVLLPRRRQPQRYQTPQERAEPLHALQGDGSAQHQCSVGVGMTSCCSELMLEGASRCERPCPSRKVHTACGIRPPGQRGMPAPFTLAPLSPA
jgi:hypothetical protein